MSAHFEDLSCKFREEVAAAAASFSSPTAAAASMLHSPPSAIFTICENSFAPRTFRAGLFQGIVDQDPDYDCLKDENGVRLDSSLDAAL